MLMTAVVLPDAFRASQFSAPGYHLNAEVFMKGINSNGVILVDSNERLYSELCDAVESLAPIGKGKNTHALFEELLKKRRQKIVRFVRTTCPSSRQSPCAEIAHAVASTCRPDALITGSNPDHALVSDSTPVTRIIPIPDYIGSDFEEERRRFHENLRPSDQMKYGEFDELIIRSTRYSRWLRLYDKQIGKGTNLSHFRRGIERILRLWVDYSHFPCHELRAELFTCVDDSKDAAFSSEVAYRRVRDDVVQDLSQEFSLQIDLQFKKDVNLICHPRHLQTQSVAILFERGFDFLNGDGTFRRSFVRIDGGCSDHLQEYRQLPTYQLPS
jgi:hypothetical protein